MSLRQSLTFGALALLPFAATTAGSAPSASPAPSAGSVVLLTGQGTAAAPTGSIRALNKGEPVYSGEIVSTGVNSYMNLGFSDGGFVLLRPDSRFHVRDYANASVVAQAATPSVKPVAKPAPVHYLPSTGSPSCQAFAGQPVHIDGCATGHLLVLPGVTFEPGSPWVGIRARVELKKLVAELKAHENLAIEIDAYADDHGPDEVNRKLSQARADAVKTYLVALGVDAARITPKGIGDDHFIADNSTDEGRETNRRVEVAIAGKAPAAMIGKASTKPKAHGKAEKPAEAVATSPVTAPAPAPEVQPSTPTPPPVAQTPVPVTPAPLVAAQPVADSGGSHAFFSLLKGGFRAVSGAIGKINHDDYEINTPVATIGIRGTDYIAVLCDAQCAHDPVITALVGLVQADGGLVAGDISGGIVVKTSKGEMALGPGEYVLVEPDGSFIVLPAIPRFLAVDPTPDPRACAAPG